MFHFRHQQLQHVLVSHALRINSNTRVSHLSFTATVARVLRVLTRSNTYVSCLSSTATIARFLRVEISSNTRVLCLSSTTTVALVSQVVTNNTRVSCLSSTTTVVRVSRVEINSNTRVSCISSTATVALVWRFVNNSNTFVSQLYIARIVSVVVCCFLSRLSTRWFFVSEVNNTSFDFLWAVVCIMSCHVSQALPLFSCVFLLYAFGEVCHLGTLHSTNSIPR